MNKPDYYKFIAIFNYYEEGISITFPDLDGCVSHADNDDEALTMAKEVLMLHLYGMEEENMDIPAPSPLSKISTAENELAVLVDVFMPPFREKQRKRFVKKTLSIPAWINAEAEHAGINFSQVLQNALVQQLGL
ncbi:MAG: type II toxin-antitoxin system HicB family antitoxin [Ruminococcus sp.]|nr:type II toxin-antitoxin system HicB family antitoxin [Ruminococcus sp.]